VKSALMGRLTSKGTAKWETQQGLILGETSLAPALTLKRQRDPLEKITSIVPRRKLAIQEPSLSLEETSPPLVLERTSTNWSPLRRTPTRESATSWTPTEKSILSTIVDLTESAPSTPNPGTSSPTCSGSLVEPELASQDWHSPWPPMLTGSPTTNGSMDTIHTNTPMSLSTTSEHPLPPSTLFSVSSTDTPCKLRLREALATFELAEYLLPPPALLRRPGLHLAKKSWISYCGALKSLLSFCLEDSSGLPKDLQLTSMVLELFALLTTLLDQVRAPRRKI